MTATMDKQATAAAIVAAADDPPGQGRTAQRIAGSLSIAGAIMMGAGGAIYSSAGADLWGLVDGDVAVSTYLTDAASSAGALHVAHTVWMVGVLVLAVGGVLLTGRRHDAASTAARATYTIGAALAMSAFMAMVALTRLAENGGGEPQLVEALAFLGARLDDVATTIIIGLGPVLLTIANRRTWMPGWLVGLGVACGAAGLLSMVSIFFGEAATFGFIIVPVGIVWTIAAGCIAITRGSVSRAPSVGHGN